MEPEKLNTNFESPPKHHVSIFIWLVLFIVLVLAGIFVLKIQNENHTACIDVVTSAKNPETGEVKTFGTPCEVPKGWVEIPTEMDTLGNNYTGWKTYRNEEYGFEFKYPAYITSKTQENGIILAPTDPDCQCDVPDGLILEAYNSFSDLKDDYKSDSKNLSEFMNEQFRFLGSTTRNVSGISWTCGDQEGPGAVVLCISQNTKGNIILSYYNLEDSLRDGVLSTFRFISTSTSTTNDIPLYPGLNWKKTERSEGEFQIMIENKEKGENYKYSYSAPMGTLWTATTTNNNINSNFYSYYSKTFSEMIWNQNKVEFSYGLSARPLSGDGVTGSMWGYIRKENSEQGDILHYVGLSERITKYKDLSNGEGPTQIGCPCEIVYKVFVSEPIYTDGKEYLSYK